MVSGWAGRWWEKVCLGCISETVRCRKMILGRDIGRRVFGCIIMVLPDLTCDLAIVTLTLKYLVPVLSQKQ